MVIFESETSDEIHTAHARTAVRDVMITLVDNMVKFNRGFMLKYY